MSRFVRTLQLLALSLPLTTLSSTAVAQLEQLANRVPGSANTIIVVNVKAAFSSPLAKAQNWEQPGRAARRDGMIALPFQSEMFLMAAELDLEFMQPLWEVAVAHLQTMPEMKAVATRSGGQLDRIAGADAVERPNDSVVVRLGPKVIGSMAPANRQQVSRWVRESRRRKSPELSPYLTSALNKATNSTIPIVLALDLQGLLSPSDVKAKLAKLDPPLDSNADLAKISKAIASLQGAQLEVQLLSPAQGKLRLDFSHDADELTKLAKPILLHVLAKNGIAIDDLQDWIVSSQGKSIDFAGKLSQSGLRRVLTVLSSPVGPLATNTAATTSSNEATAEASQHYFQTVTGYLNDLFFSDRQPQSAYEIKTWVQRYARKIEDLNTHQVDPEAIDFGQQVVDSLHEIVSVISRSQQRSDIRESTMNDYSGRRRYGRYGAYGYFEKSYATRDRQIIQADEANRGLQASKQIVNQLRDLSAQTRQTMTQRYDRPF